MVNIQVLLTSITKFTTVHTQVMQQRVDELVTENQHLMTENEHLKIENKHLNDRLKGEIMHFKQRKSSLETEITRLLEENKRMTKRLGDISSLLR